MAAKRKEPIELTILGGVILLIIVGAAVWFVLQREFPGAFHGHDGIIAEKYSRCIAGTRVVDGIPVTTYYDPEHTRGLIERGELDYDVISEKMEELGCAPIDWDNVLPNDGRSSDRR